MDEKAVANNRVTLVQQQENLNFMNWEQLQENLKGKTPQIEIDFMDEKGKDFEKFKRTNS